MRYTQMTAGVELTLKPQGDEQLQRKIPDLETLRLFGKSSVRVRIIAALNTFGSMAVSQIAERLSVTPGSLYYHLDLLQKANLITVVSETDEGDDAKSKRYSASACDIVFSYIPEDINNRRAICEITEYLARVHSQKLIRLYKTGRAIVAKKDVNCQFYTTRVWLTPSEAREFQAMCLNLASFLEERRHPPEASECEEYSILLSGCLVDH